PTAIERGSTMPGKRRRSCRPPSVRSGSRARSGICEPRDPPHPPQGRRVRERISMDEEEVRGAPLEDSARVGVVEEFSAADGRGGEGLPWLEPRLDERFDLPREVVGPEGSAAEVRPRRNPDAGTVGQADALDRPFPSSGDALLPLVADESSDCRGRRKGGPRAEDRQRAD